MSLDIDLYKNRLDAYKVGTKDGQIEVLKDQIFKDFKNNPSYFQVKINDVSQDVIIIEENSLNRKPDTKIIITKPDENINVGDLITWDSKYWLCIETDLNKLVYTKGVIGYCSNTISFQDSTLTKQTIPCIIEDKNSQTSDGLDETKHLILADDMILVTISNNDVTKQISLNQRFIFNNSEYEVYKVTDIKSLVRPGLLLIIMKKDQYQASVDNLEENIADYVEPSTSEIVGSSTINLNQQQTYTIDIDVSWSLSNSNASIVSQNSRSITLKGVTMGSIILTADDGLGNIYTKEITIKSVF